MKKLVWESNGCGLRCHDAGYGSGLPGPLGLATKGGRKQAADSVRNFFGMDLTNMSIFGVPLKDLLKWDNVKNAARSGWDWMKIFLARIPWWGYAIGAGIVLWHLPAGYLFGIFPL